MGRFVPCGEEMEPIPAFDHAVTFVLTVFHQFPPAGTSQCASTPPPGLATYFPVVVVVIDFPVLNG
jgi:hypothetical protein